MFSFLLCRITIPEELLWDLDDVGAFEKFMRDAGNRPQQHIEEVIGK